MDRLDSMEVFVAVARAASFAGAARATGRTPASVTRAVAALEAHLGVRLFDRTTRRVRLTEAGAAYLDEARAALDAVAEAEATAKGRHGAPAGRVRIAAPILFGTRHVTPVVLAFLDRYPDCQADLELSDRFADVLGEGVDVAVRIGELPPSDLCALRVGAVRDVEVAAPGYLSALGDAPPERVATPGIGPAPEARLRVNTVGPALAAAEAGFGTARVPSYQAADALAEGRLVETAGPGRARPVHLVHAGGNRVPGRVRAFLDLAAEALRRDPALREADG